MARDRRETAEVAAGLAPNSMGEVDYLRTSYSSSKLHYNDLFSVCEQG